MVVFGTRVVVSLVQTVLLKMKGADKKRCGPKEVSPRVPRNSANERIPSSKRIINLQ